MRRLVSLCSALLVGAVLLLTLAGCGGGSDTATDSSSTPPVPVGSAVKFQLVGVVTATQAGGTVASQAAPLTDADDVDAFASTFNSQGLASQLHDLVVATKVPDGKVLYGAVVYVGCVPPTDVTVTQGPSGLEIKAVQGAKHPNIECLAAMTSVAVVMVDESAANG